MSLCQVNRASADGFVITHPPDLGAACPPENNQGLNTRGQSQRFGSFLPMAGQHDPEVLPTIDQVILMGKLAKARPLPADFTLEHPCSINETRPIVGLRRPGP